ncbi:MAG: DUF1700 domain-containing protein [Clostridiales bacterium]|nr:DUF1700 domain-containing protein [Clostridiales bacterium]
MTKYEWERELEKNLHTLPKDEIKRVLEYYNELFIDKIERGGTETSVIAEFGNPFDVANKIIAETADLDASDNAKSPSETIADDRKEDRREKEKKKDIVRDPEPSETRENNASVPKSTDGASEKKSGSVLRALVVILVCILLGGTVAGVISGLFAAVAGLTVGSVGMVIGGFIAAIGSLIAGIGVGLWATVAQIGVCIIVIGVGIFLFPLCIKLMICMGKLMVKICGKVARFITGKTEAHNEN